jgi:hypothetical protein
VLGTKSRLGAWYQIKRSLIQSYHFPKSPIPVICMQGVEGMDGEGRLLMTEFDGFYVVSA